MPRVNIREIDNTGSDTRSYIENIALLPALKLEGYDEDDNLITVDGTYTTLASFEAQVKKVLKTREIEWIDPEGEPDKYKAERAAVQNLNNIKDVFIQDKGYAMAHILLSYGLPIDYKGVYNLIVTYLESGDYATVTPNIQELEGKEVIKNLYTEYSDKGKYDGKFILPPYIDLDKTVTTTDRTVTPNKIIRSIEERFIINVDERAMQCAGNRGDSYALIYSPNYLKGSTEINKWIQENFNEIATTLIPRPAVSWAVNETTEQYGSYGTHYRSNIIVPRYKITSPYTYSLDGGESGDYVKVDYTFINATFPGYLYYLLCYVTNTKTTPDWFAISGAVRGSGPFAIRLIEQFGDADIDLFQPRSASGEIDNYGNDKNLNHIATNGICNIRPYGNIVWGNRTMHPLNVPANGSSEEIQLVASDFLNIRSLCCDLKKTIYRAARRYTFDPNSDELWFNFKSAVTPLLEKMKSNQGIRDYQFIKIATRKKALFAAKIIITPIEAVEDFDITVQLDDSIEVGQN